MEEIKQDAVAVETAQEPVAGKAEWVAKLRYTKSFLAKVYLSQKELKEAYCSLFNALASYAGVTTKTAFSCVTFSVKRKPLAMITLTGKSLNLYLALEPSRHAVGRYRLTDVSTKKRFARVPAKYRVRTHGGLRFALKLIQEAAAEFALEKRQEILPPVTPKDFPTTSIRELISRGLIRTMGGGGRPGRVMKEIPFYVEKEGTKEDAGNDLFSDTVSTENALTERHEEYNDLLASFEGEGEVRFVKQKIIRSVDQSWVDAIESCLPALDEVTRNPSHFIEETEELLPIERTKRVTTRSIRHLSQHTGLISRIEGDVVIPSKLLNVFRDESSMTYENKFINTLLIRLFDFVSSRFEEAEEFGASRRKMVFEYTDVIRQGEERGKVTVNLEVSVPTEEKEKNTFFQSDLWARVKKLREVLTDYRGSEFATMMGNAVVRPPVVRTNPILKNKDLRQCLELWEFLEGYDDEDAGVSVSENELEISDAQRKFVMQGAAQQYLMFRRFAGMANPIVSEERKKNEYKLPPQYLAAKEEVACDTASEETEDETAFWVDVALQAEEIYLKEWKEEQARLKAEREEMLRLEEEERAERERLERERIHTTVDNTPAKYDEYVPATFEDEERPAAPEQPDEEEEIPAMEDSVVYVMSFAAKLRAADEELKGYYVAIANALLSKEGVHERNAFDHADFYKGRRTIARVMLVGKTLRVYFMPLSAELVAKYALTDRADVKKFIATPHLLKVKGPRSFKKALALIAEISEGAEAKKPALKAKEDFLPMSTEDALLAGEVRRRVITALQRERLTRMRMRPEAPKEEYDYTEEVAAYKKQAQKREKKAKELVMDVEVSPVAIGKAIERTENEEIASIPEEKKPVLEGAEGDPLFARVEAISDEAVSLVEPKKKEEPEPEAKPIVLQPDGDVLTPKPISADQIFGQASFVNPQPKPEPAPQAPAQKKGLLSRIFRRRGK